MLNRGAQTVPVIRLNRGAQPNFVVLHITANRGGACAGCAPSKSAPGSDIHKVNETLRDVSFGDVEAKNVDIASRRRISKYMVSFFNETRT